MFVVRETPMNDIHLENMWVMNHLSVLSKGINLYLAYRLFLRRASAIKFPSVSAYCIRPQTIDDLTNQTWEVSWTPVSAAYPHRKLGSGGVVVGPAYHRIRLLG